MEVRNEPGGQPRVLICGGAKEEAVQRGIGDILISISHCRTYATAYALAIGPGPLKARANGADDGYRPHPGVGGRRPLHQPLAM